MNNKCKNSTPQGKQAFYLVPPRTNDAQTGEAPFFEMHVGKQESMPAGEKPYFKKP